LSEPIKNLLNALISVQVSWKTINDMTLAKMDFLGRGEALMKRGIRKF
jgi:hypothetical protein